VSAKSLGHAGTASAAGVKESNRNKWTIQSPFAQLPDPRCMDTGLQ
jgi:hypothetical protein